MEPAERAANEILATIEAAYTATHDYVVVDPQSFRHLDLVFYERTAQVLSVEGFRRVADMEERTVTATPGGKLMPVLIRSMRSKDGAIMVALYHPRIKPVGVRILLWLLGKLPGKVVDMETEFQDGSFVVTSNAASSVGFDLPTLISAEYMPAKSSVLGVLQRHIVRVTAHTAARPGVASKKVVTHAELLASQNRLNAIKAAFRGEIGGITKAELDRLAIYGKSISGDVHAVILRERVRRAS